MKSKSAHPSHSQVNLAHWKIESLHHVHNWLRHFEQTVFVGAILAPGAEPQSSLLDRIGQNHHNNMEESLERPSLTTCEDVHKA